MTNIEFEIALRDAATKNLRPEIDVEKYVNITLDEIWDGEKYCDAAGHTYHEINASDTWHGRPVVVS